MKVREQVKTLLVAQDVTMGQLAQMMSDKMDKEYTLANLSGKLIRGTLPYNEVLIIAELLGYKIKFEEIK